MRGAPRTIGIQRQYVHPVTRSRLTPSARRHGYTVRFATCGGTNAGHRRRDLRRGWDNRGGRDDRPESGEPVIEQRRPDYWRHCWGQRWCDPSRRWHSVRSAANSVLTLTGENTSTGSNGDGLTAIDLNGAWFQTSRALPLSAADPGQRHDQYRRCRLRPERPGQRRHKRHPDVGRQSDTSPGGRSDDIRIV